MPKIKPKQVRNYRVVYKIHDMKRYEIRFIESDTETKRNDIITGEIVIEIRGNFSFEPICLADIRFSTLRPFQPV